MISSPERWEQVATTETREIQAMRISMLLRGALVALIALFTVALHGARADTGGVTLVVFKGGWIIGGSAGHGTLSFHGRHYPLSGVGIEHGLGVRCSQTG